MKNNHPDVLDEFEKEILEAICDVTEHGGSPVIPSKLAAFLAKHIPPKADDSV